MGCTFSPTQSAYRGCLLPRAPLSPLPQDPPKTLSSHPAPPDKNRAPAARFCAGVHFPSPSCSITLPRLPATSIPLHSTPVRPPQAPPTTPSRPQLKTEPRRVGFVRGAFSLPIPLDRPSMAPYHLNLSPPHSGEARANSSHCPQSPPAENRAPAARFCVAVHHPAPTREHPGGQPSHQPPFSPVCSFVA